MFGKDHPHAKSTPLQIQTFTNNFHTFKDNDKGWDCSTNTVVIHKATDLSFSSPVFTAPV